jgi:hypothetical protein
MLHLRCPRCSTVTHVPVWHVGSDTCMTCHEALVRAPRPSDQPRRPISIPLPVATWAISRPAGRRPEAWGGEGIGA